MSEAYMKKHKGFTLIELLVVIAIISILIGIIRPMLSAAASRSRDMECESRLRQVGMALAAYAQDYGAFPERLTHVDHILQDKTQLVCPGTGTDYRYFHPDEDAERDDVLASCVDPAKAPKNLPHSRGESYLLLRAGGSVTTQRTQANVR